jgi:hypothetical protein
LKARNVIHLLMGLLAASAANAAECPDEVSAGKGFALEKPGIRSEFRPSGELVVHVLNIYDDDQQQAQFFLGGLVEVFRTSQKGSFALLPLADVKGIFPLKSKAQHRIEYLIMESREKAAIPEAIELNVAGAETYGLGECEYDVLAVQLTQVGSKGDKSDLFTALYAPVLKAVVARRYDEGTSAEQTIGYKAIKPLPN